MTSTALPITRKFSLYEAILLRVFDQMPFGRLELALPDGRRFYFGDGEGHKAAIHVSNMDFFSKCVLYGDVGFAESYIDGDWRTDSVTEVVKWFILNIDHNPVLTGKGIRRY